jgi:PAS domain-containing protein
MAEELKQRVDRLKKMLFQLEKKNKEIDRLNDEIKRFAVMMRALCDSLPIMVWAKDLDRNYLFANKLCCEFLLNTDVKEVIGKNDMFFADRERAVSPGNKHYHTFGETCDESDRFVITTRKTLSVVESGFAKGKPLSMAVKKIPFLVNGGNFIGLIGMAKDITGKTRRRGDGAYG